MFTDEFLDSLADRIAVKVTERMKFQENGNKPNDTAQDAKDPFKRLKLRMQEYGYDHSYFARKLREKYGLNMSKATMSIRMTGKRPWLITEMYAAMDALQIPHSEMHLYFPKCGVPQKRK